MQKMSQTRNDGAEVGREVIALGSLHTEDVGLGTDRTFYKERIKGISRETDGGCVRNEWQGQELLPGILNEITLNEITPKLPWTAIYTLSSVSSGWRQAIKSRLVYEARSRAHSTDALVLIHHFRSFSSRRIGLYSSRNRKFYRIPAIPNHYSGIPGGCQCVSLGGKVYVLGGLLDCTRDPSSRVYVIDLAGQKGWQQCASMKYGRLNFGCGVLDGKIYVCGGCSDSEDRSDPEEVCSAYSGSGATCVPELYDPELDVWSPLKPMGSMRLQNQVAAVGDEILVSGGRVYKHHLPLNIYFGGTYFSEVYNPVSDEWRKVDEAVDSVKKKLFTAEGQIYTMDSCRIRVYDPDKKSWTVKHSFCPIEQEIGQSFDEVALPVVVGTEVVRIFDRRSCYGHVNKLLLLQSIGFGGKNTRIAWQKAECSFPLAYKTFMCAVHL